MHSFTQVSGLRLLSCLLLLLALPVESEEQSDTDLPLLFSDDFSTDSLERWVMTDEKAWELAEDEGSQVLSLARMSKYAPPVRSPHNIARVRDLTASDFVMEARVKQTGREYGHRDLCFFFGYQDPSHFYYVHLASVADDHANSIFLVNDAPRVSIAKERTDGTQWTAGYHRVRIVREAASGKIEVYFDDMEKPVMVAEDKHFTEGGIGFGSFDDVGYFDDIRIHGNSVSPVASDAADE